MNGTQGRDLRKGGVVSHPGDGHLNIGLSNKQSLLPLNPNLIVSVQSKYPGKMNAQGLEMQIREPVRASAKTRDSVPWNDET